MKVVNGAKSCKQLIELVNLGRARIVVDKSSNETKYLAYSTSGAPLAEFGKTYEYMAAAHVATHGAGDGLFPGLDQTTA